MTASIKAIAREAGTSAATAEAAMRVGFADIQRGRLVFIHDKMGEMLIEFAALVRAQALEEAARHFDERDAGAGGYYLPHEPAQIISALPPSE